MSADHCPFCGHVPKVKEDRETIGSNRPRVVWQCSCSITCEGYCPVKPHVYQMVRVSMGQDEDKTAALARELALRDWNTRTAPR